MGLPTTFQAPNISLQEMGINGLPCSEKNNGLDDTPGADDPGGGVGARYLFISDIVPEPSAWIMMGTAIAILGIGSRLRKGHPR